jgi:hypothetical protein
VKFYATHNAGFTEYPFPKDIFLKFVRVCAFCARRGDGTRI